MQAIQEKMRFMKYFWETLELLEFAKLAIKFEIKLFGSYFRIIILGFNI